MKKLLMLVSVSLAALNTSGQTKEDFARVNGVRLHYIDWGGHGEAILLLAGMGNTADVFNDFAAAFTDNYHVIGLTRRGYGKSDKPASGYEISNLAKDIIQFMDAQNLRKVYLMGHSFAGTEITEVASKYPDRILKIVYLDALGDYKEQGRIMLLSEDLPPFMRKKMLLDAGRTEEANKIVTEEGPASPNDKFNDILIKNITNYTFDFSKVNCPALAFYMAPEEHFAIQTAVDEAQRQRMNTWWQSLALPHIKSNMQKVKSSVKDIEVIELNTPDHFIFRGDKKDEVITAIKDFLKK
jgi:pimeloyl-ACP methyl ester carboxylesterase